MNIGLKIRFSIWKLGLLQSELCIRFFFLRTLNKPLIVNHIFLSRIYTITILELEKYVPVVEMYDLILSKKSHEKKS